MSKEIDDKLERLTEIHKGVLNPEHRAAIKFDDGKIRYELFPPAVLQEVCAVLTCGAVKYGDLNWMKGGGLPFDKLYSSAMRHIESARMGDEIDDEFGCSHLAHAICCLVMMRQLQSSGDEYGSFMQINEATQNRLRSVRAGVKSFVQKVIDAKTAEMEKIQ